MASGIICTLQKDHIIFVTLSFVPELNSCRVMEWELFFWTAILAHYWGGIPKKNCVVWMNGNMCKSNFKHAIIYSKQSQLYLQICFIFLEFTCEVGFHSCGHVTEWKKEHNSYPQKFFNIRFFKFFNHTSRKSHYWAMHALCILLWVPFKKKFNLD